MNDVCGIGRCRAVPDLSCFSVPICQPHWTQCCDEARASIVWLRKRVKREWRETLTRFNGYDEIPKPSRGPATRESKSNGSDEPVRIKPARRLRERDVDHVDPDEPVLVSERPRLRRRVSDEPVRIP